MLQHYSLLRMVSVMLLGLTPVQALAAEDWSPRIPSRGSAAEVHEHSVAPLLIAALGGLVVGAAIMNKAANDRVRASVVAAPCEQPGYAGGVSQAQSCAPVPACEAPVQAPRCATPAEDASARFGYYDLSSQHWFGTIEDCQAEVEYAQRPTFVRVIERSTGENVGTICWVDGEWSVVGSGDVSLDDMAGYQRARFERSGQRFGDMRSPHRDRYRHGGYRGRPSRRDYAERPHWMSDSQ